MCEAALPARYAAFAVVAWRYWGRAHFLLIPSEKLCPFLPKCLPEYAALASFSHLIIRWLASLLLPCFSEVNRPCS